MSNLLNIPADQPGQPATGGQATWFADLIIPVPLPRLFTYRVPAQMQLQAGMRVVVPFGARKVTTAVVSKLHQQPPKEYQAKYIYEVLDALPTLNQWQLNLLEWMATYYVCTQGEVLQAMLPSGFKITSESHLQLNPSFDVAEADGEFSEDELLLLAKLKEVDSLTYDQARQVLDEKEFSKVLKSLTARRAIILFEQIKDRYTPKLKRYLLPGPGFETPDMMRQLLKLLERSPRQSDIVQAFLLMSKTAEHEQLPPVAKEDLFQRFQLSDPALKGLIDKGIFKEQYRQVSRFRWDQAKTERLPQLSPAQQTAFDSMREGMAADKPVLLHGLTGSGKTELYIHHIAQQLQSGNQVLLLLPEIALTAHIVQRLATFFGDSMGVYHSKFTDNERVEIWRGIAEGRINLVVGVRSAVFLPFTHLGLIIVDEEHENSYKQYDPAPRYHARDVAWYLSRMHQACFIMGSATPSIESFYNAKTGNYHLVSLTERFGGAVLPAFEIIDLKEEKRNKRLHQEFSATLLETVKNTLANKQQVILFQNRRGYAPYLYCTSCEFVPKCPNCDVSLTYHMQKGELRCHYCGHHAAPPVRCPQCGSATVQTMGFGTEKLEETVQLLLPGTRVLRMDTDSTRSKTAYERILETFDSQEADVLVGTQMLSKGLDFSNVNLVGIFDVDRMMYYPDFRAAEKAFQLITQVAGRAGRRQQRGLVVIQSNFPQHKLLEHIIKGDYLTFYEEEIAEREKYDYPPFSRLIRVTFKHEEEKTVIDAARTFADMLAQHLNEGRVMGPQAPVISKVRNQFLMEILVKLEKQKINIKAVKKLVADTKSFFAEQKTWKKVDVVIDVDPV